MMDAGVVPLVGVTVSQGALDTETVNGKGAPPLLTCTVCEGGAGSPVRYENAVLVVLRVSTGGAETFAVTVIVCGLPEADGAVIVIVPVCAPWVSNEVLREILRLEGVLPLAGLKLIQGAVVVAENVVEPLVLDIWTFWAAGAGSPAR